MLDAMAEATMTDAPEGDAPDAGPNRRCIVTGQVLPTERLIRFVVGPEERVVPDLEGRLPGRGMWLSATRDVLNTALAKHAFARAARRPVAADPDLADRIETLLARRCVELLGLARRAGQGVAGFEKVRAALTDGRRGAEARTGLLLEAADGADEGIEKLRALAPGIAVARALTGDELGAAFGRERTVHALIAPGALAGRVREECGRLAGFRAANGN